MRNIAIVIIAAALLYLPANLAGCGGPLPGLRWAPSEEQKQAAEVTRDLAQASHLAGLPPGSDAARALARSAAIAAAHTGPPKQPIPLEDLIPPAVTRAWDTKDRQVLAAKLREDIYTRTHQSVATALADLADDLRIRGQITAEEIMHRFEAIVQMAVIGGEIASAVPIPAAPELTAEERARIDALTAEIRRMASKAQADAAIRPTAREVVQRGREEADDWIDLVGGLAEDYWPAGVGVLGFGSITYGARQRKRRRQAEGQTQDAQRQAYDAEHAKQNAERVAEMARQSIADAQREAIAAIREAGTPLQTLVESKE